MLQLWRLWYEFNVVCLSVMDMYIVAKRWVRRENFFTNEIFRPSSRLSG